MEEHESESDQMPAEGWQNSTSIWEAPGVTLAPDEPQGVSPAACALPPEEYIEQALRPLLAEIASLRRDFEAKVKYDGSKERIIESLHRELQVHQQGLHFQILQPVFMDLISLYDDMSQVIESLEIDPRFASEQTVRHLRIFRETTEEILHRHGVEFFTLEEEVFQPRRQRSTRAIPTPDPALDRHIARRVRCGFLYGERLLRPEIVDIYKYQPE